MTCYMKGNNLSDNFSSDTMEAEASWKCLGWKKNSCLRILYLVKIVIKTEGEIKTFLDKWKIRQLIASRSTL